ANAPVDFATSVVSFERVFEVIDLPLEITTKPDAVELNSVRGALTFEDVSFHYELRETNLLSEVRRFGQMQNVTAVLSGGTSSTPTNGKNSAEEEPTRARSQARPQALEQISFDVKAGQLVALVGPSG